MGEYTLPTGFIQTPLVLQRSVTVYREPPRLAGVKYWCRYFVRHNITVSNLSLCRILEPVQRIEEIWSQRSRHFTCSIIEISLYVHQDNLCSWDTYISELGNTLFNSRVNLQSTTIIIVVIIIKEVRTFTFHYEWKELERLTDFLLEIPSTNSRTKVTSTLLKKKTEVYRPEDVKLPTHKSNN